MQIIYFRHLKIWQSQQTTQHIHTPSSLQRFGFSTISSRKEVYVVLVNRCWQLKRILHRSEWLNSKYNKKSKYFISSISSDHLVQCKSAEETNMQLIQRNDDAQLQELYRQRKCVHVIVKNETEIKSAGNNFAALCASHIRNQLFSRHFNNRENSPSSSSGEMFAPRLKKRKFRRLTRSWKFDGEPIAKKTRSGHIYGYVNQIAP